MVNNFISLSDTLARYLAHTLPILIIKKQVKPSTMASKARLLKLVGLQKMYV